MTNELGTTLQDIKAKADRKHLVLENLHIAFERLQNIDGYYSWNDTLETIRKYIEEN